MAGNHKNIQQLANFLKKNPADSFTKFALALELLKAEEITKAKFLFESVLKQDPGYLGVYYHLGKLYEHTDRYREAKDLYTRGMSFAKEQNNERTLSELKEALDDLNQRIDDD